jgi:hypothetical protein
VHALSGGCSAHVAMWRHGASGERWVGRSTSPLVGSSSPHCLLSQFEAAGLERTLFFPTFVMLDIKHRHKHSCEDETEEKES